MNIPGLERHLGSVELNQLSSTLRRLASRLQMEQVDLTRQNRDLATRTRGGAYYGPEERRLIVQAKERLKKVETAFRARFTHRGEHRTKVFRPFVEKGATHAALDISSEKVHFYKLPKAHAGRVYAPIAGSQRLPLFKEVKKKRESK
ncbi:MAG: hypothetical protein V1722_00335 [Candidatus Micrarchaeota archaeon]